MSWLATLAFLVQRPKHAWVKLALMHGLILSAVVLLPIAAHAFRAWVEMGQDDHGCAVIRACATQSGYRVCYTIMSCP